ncbi:MAG: glycosyltransferase [Chloroflexi bacterium]|nr:glycosyltransferase [Chloroflexota bacterium]
MNVLIVSPWLPHPDIRHAGGQHVWHTVRTLAEREHRVSVLCYGRGETPEQVAPLAVVCDQLAVVTPAYSWQQKLVGLRQGWRTPWRLGRRTHHTARAHLRTICRAVGIDVVHFAWTEMGRYLDAVPPGVGTVLGTLDVEYVVRPRELALYPPGGAKLRAARRTRHLVRAEQRYVRAADVTLACSEADRECLLRLAPNARVHVITPWIDLDAVRNVIPQPVPGRLVFMGALDRIANVAAAEFLIDDVWPLVRNSHPDAALRIVGAFPPDSLLMQAQSDPHLTVTGFVPDLAAEWAAADVAVCPSLIGGGLLIKVAQAMAAGCPVVTTPNGNAGVNAPDGAIVVAGDGAAFAEAVLRLLGDRAYRAAVAAAGREYALWAFDWAESMRRLEAAYHTAIL